MSYNTRRRAVVNQKVGIDLTHDHEVSLKPRLRSCKVLPSDNTGSYAPFCQSLNSKEFQGN